MAEDCETLKDVVAWIRRHASVHGYDLADRIEAAWELERKRFVNGNMAVMRAALEKVRDMLVSGIHNGSMDCHVALEIVEEALAAPPRNCDLFQAPLVAVDEWVKFVVKARDGKVNPCDGCPYEVKCTSCLAGWLYRVAESGEDAPSPTPF